jgi:hypothetical protein
VTVIGVTGTSGALGRLTAQYVLQNYSPKDVVLLSRAPASVALSLPMRGLANRRGISPRATRFRIAHQTAGMEAESMGRSGGASGRVVEFCGVVIGSVMGYSSGSVLGRTGDERGRWRLRCPS